MKISVQCPTCFQSYPVKPEFAGKKFKCKECQTVLTVPRPKKKVAVDEDLDDVEVVDEYESERPVRPTRVSRKPQQARPKFTLPTISLPTIISASTIQIILVGLVWVGAASLVAHLTMRFGHMTVAILMFGVGQAISGSCGVMVMLHAFSEKISYGLAYLFVPCFGLYYAITRWEDVGTYVIGILGGSAVAFAGLQLARQGNQIVLF